LLILLHIPYDSEEAIILAHQLISFLQEHSKTASERLAQERGSFVHWNKSIYYPHTPIRNATLLSIAPTGTISIIAGCSSSIESLFSLAFQRQLIPEPISLDEINPYFVDYLRQHNLYSSALMEEVKQTSSVQSISTIPGPVKDLFKTSLEIPANRQLQHQLAFSQYVDNAVSKTVNLPKTASRQEINTLYRSAWQKGSLFFAITLKVNKYLKKESGIQYRTATYVIPNG
jgi:ribonucleoside-diphosphate reductase alpha chain